MMHDAIGVILICSAFIGVVIWILYDHNYWLQARLEWYKGLNTDRAIKYGKIIDDRIKGDRK